MLIACLQHGQTRGTDGISLVSWYHGTRLEPARLDREEGRRIAEHLGDGKAIILQNHGLLTVGRAS